MYTNIPIAETLEITKKLLTQKGIENHITKQAINILNTIMKQNYFQHNNQIYIQHDGLPMGNPLSGTLANIYLNELEKQHVNNDRNKYKNNIIYWHRYVDDILILFRGTNRQLSDLHRYLNTIDDKIKFTLENEKEKSINFLDMTITNINQKHQFKIYRKLTQTDQTIHNTSNHPSQHKSAAYNHMLNRLNTIPMNNIDYMEELKTIEYIAEQNNFSKNVIQRMNQKIKDKIKRQLLTTMYTQEENPKKYITLEYHNKTNNVMRKILKKYNYNIAYKTTNKLHKKLTQQHKDIDCGVYKLSCNNCSMFYIGQTGRSFSKRFAEHISEIKNATKFTTFKSKYAEHIVTQNHTYTDEKTNLQVIHRIKKGDMLDRLEEFEIYKNKNNPLIMNEKTNTKTNKIYDLISNS